MIRPLLLALVVAGCGKSDRARDCDEVRNVLQPGGMPARYAAYQPGATTYVDPQQKLRTTTWRDPEVREAVKAMVATGWTVYTPVSADASPIGKLRALCGLKP